MVLFGIVCFIFIRQKQLKTGHFILAALFGFMLNQSTAAKPIQDFLSQVAKSISGIAS
ncbi:membrane protein [Streptomyces sp. XY431]|nr:membrane protein [Streptomyces sp. XY431]